MKSFPLRNLFRFFVVLTALALFPSCGKNGWWNQQKTFTIHKGVNISHWLSQSNRRGEARDTFFTEKDVAFIASCGYDHIRLPIDEEQMWTPEGQKIDTAFRLLHNALAWCEKYHLRTIVDLHIIRSHHFLMQAPPLWTDPAEQDKFIRLWKDLSAELSKYPVNRIAYELMNEAVAPDPEMWNKLIERTVAELRKTEPLRKIVIGSNRWQSASTFDQLLVPANDTNIILSFHFYHPLALTHYKAGWTKVGEYNGPVKYPGITVEENDMKGLPEDLVQALRYENGNFNKDTFLIMIRKPLHLADSLKLPLYCGEFGCLPSAPREMRLQWYKDMVSLLEENNIAWANWDYKGGFGIVFKGEPDKDLIKILTGVTVQ